MARLRKRIVGMEDRKLPLTIHKWDVSLKRNTWAKNIEHILQYANMLEGTTHLSYIDLDVLTRLKELDREKWMTSASALPKLRTFIELFNETDQKALSMQT